MGTLIHNLVRVMALVDVILASTTNVGARRCYEQIAQAHGLSHTRMFVNKAFTPDQILHSIGIDYYPSKSVCPLAHTKMCMCLCVCVL